MKDKIIRVLLIEDNPVDARLVENFLTGGTNPAFTLTIADRLSSGLSFLAAGGIDALLLDLCLPDSEGLATLRQAQRAAPRLPIVVLSGDLDKQLAVDAVAAGAQDYLVKGCYSQDLLARSLRYAIERQQTQQRMPMKGEIRLLQIEDSAMDAELIVSLFEQSGYVVRGLRVDTEAKMREALSDREWDLIIADYSLPNFSAPAALQIFQESHRDIPFMVVSGAIGEDTAVRMMKAGAHDYLLKDRLERLPVAVERELTEAALRREKREGDEKLCAAHAELEGIYANAPVLMFALGKDACVDKINELAARFSGFAAHDCIGRHICELLHCARPGGGKMSSSCSDCAFYRTVSDALTGGERHDPLEFWTSTGGDEGKACCLLISVAPIGAEGSRTVLICAQDVTRRKEAERSLEESVHSLEAALAQNTVLFQEVHHRVKNNLQIVASLLSMKARKGKDRIGADDLKSCETRIRSMALIHELLYSQKDMTSVDFAQYIRKIAPELLASYEREHAFSLRLKIDPTVLSIDQSIPCGLIMNELVTNAAKYAYPNHSGEILIQLASEGDRVRMTVADQGVGLPVMDGTGTSLGMQLIHILTKQLHGTLEVVGSPGTTVTLCFPRNQSAGVGHQNGDVYPGFQKFTATEKSEASICHGGVTTAISTAI